MNPTYHFAIDGRRESLYDGDDVKEIKCVERNNAVYQSACSWADYLRSALDSRAVARQGFHTACGAVLRLVVTPE